MKTFGEPWRFDERGFGKWEMEDGVDNQRFIFSYIRADSQ